MYLLVDTLKSNLNHFNFHIFQMILFTRYVLSGRQDKGQSWSQVLYFQSCHHTM